MSDKEPETVRKIQYNFNNFLWKCLDKIETAMDEGDYILAMERAVRLVNYLPAQIKKEFRPKAQTLRKRVIEKTKEIEGVDDYTTRMRRLDFMQRLASRLVPEFINDLLIALDERGYLEVKPRQVPRGYEAAGYE